MSFLVLDCLIENTTTPWGTAHAANTAIREPWGDPQGCGLYQAPQGFSGPQDLTDVVASGNYSVIGMRRRSRSEG